MERKRAKGREDLFFFYKFLHFVIGGNWRIGLNWHFPRFGARAGFIPALYLSVPPFIPALYLFGPIRGGSWRRLAMGVSRPRRLAMGQALSFQSHCVAGRGAPCAHFWGALFFKARLVFHRPGARAAGCPPWRPFVSRLGWSFIVQLFFQGSAGCSWPPWRSAGCTAPPSSFFKARLV